jgi:hypothetical protein
MIDFLIGGARRSDLPLLTMGSTLAKCSGRTAARRTASVLWCGGGRRELMFRAC